MTVAKAGMRRSTAQLFLFFAIVLSLAIMCAWPRLLSFEYHLRHGDTVFANGVRVPVPKDFYVSSQDRVHDDLALSLFSSSVGIPFHRGAAASMSVFQSPSSPAFQPAQLERLVDLTINLAKGDGFGLKATTNLSIANRPGYCLQFASERDVEVLQRCFIEGSTVVIYFRGNPKYLGDFGSVLNGIVLN